MKDEEKKILSPADAAKARESFDPNSDLPPDADAEERFNNFWKKNGTAVFGAMAFVALLITGIQGYGYIQTQNELKKQAEFGEATTPEAKLSFAVDHPGHALSGLAYIEIADAEYARGEFLQATNHYEAAIIPLTGAESPLAGRARLGAAISRIRHGDAAGVQQLEDIARDPSVIEMLRAQASYHHAVAAWKDGDIAAVRRSLDLLDSFANARDWQAAGIKLSMQIPALQTLQEQTLTIE